MINSMFQVVKYLRIKLSEGSFQCINLEPRGSKYYNEVSIQIKA